MNTNRFNPGALFLLLVFSFQAMASGMGGQLLLCIGCDQTGFALGVRQALLPASPLDRCCSSDDISKSDEDSNSDMLVELPISECDCVDIELQRYNTSYSSFVHSSDELASVNALPVSIDLWSLISACVNASPRGPPEHSVSTSERTLFALRTSLTL